MHRVVTALPIAALIGLAGCGGGDTVTETVTVTQTVTAPAPQASGTTQAAPAAAAPAGLGPDEVALIGTFDMEVTDTDPPGLNASNASKGQREEWRLSTSCSGDDCTVQVRRQLRSGGLETVELEPEDDEPGQWSGEFRSVASCGPEERRTDASLVVRGLQAQERVARKLEAYWRAEDIECNRQEGGTARYTGTLR